MLDKIKPTPDFNAKRINVTNIAIKYALFLFLKRCKAKNGIRYCAKCEGSKKTEDDLSFIDCNIIKSSI